MGPALKSDGTDFTPTLRKESYPTISPLSANLTGKNVFITGASKGIGLAIALSYARAGVSTIGLGARSDLEAARKEIQSAVAELDKPIPEILCVKLDVSDQASVENAAKEVEKAFKDGRIDILVNNAGTLEPLKPLAQSDPDAWWHTYSVNVRGPYLMMRSFIPFMLSNGGAKQIVNIVSTGALQYNPNMSSYQSGKLALLRLTELVETEYGGHGILCFSVHPGFVLTNITTNFEAALGTEVILENFKDKPDLAGDTIVFLTKERRDWLAGRYISVAWDMDELLAKKEEIIERDLLKVRMAV